jgi:hypothetical protein
MGKDYMEDEQHRLESAPGLPKTKLKKSKQDQRNNNNNNMVKLHFQIHEHRVGSI